MADNKSQIEALRKLGCSEEEIKQILAEDEEIDKMSMKEVTADLSAEQKKAIKDVSRGKKAPTVYQFSKRERKENPTKRGIIDEISKFLLENVKISAENVEILNKEREISFKIGENSFSLTLTQHRKPKGE